FRVGKVGEQERPGRPESVGDRSGTARAVKGRADHMRTTTTTAPVWSRGAVARILLGWAAVTAMFLAGPGPDDRFAAPILALLLCGIVVVIVLCASGVVTQAEQLARRLGEPY